MSAATSVYPHSRVQLTARPSPHAPSPFAAGLLRACHAGDPDAWDRLFQASIPMITAIARSDFGLHREDAEDVVQMVHLKLYGHLEELRDTASFTAWLRRMTRHAIIDLLRQKRQTLSLDALTEDGAWGASIAGEADSPEGTDASVAIRLDVQRALASLPPLYREPVIYYLIHSKPQDEIGRLLGRPRSTVATQIQRGLQKLRGCLVSGYGDGHAA